MARHTATIRGIDVVWFAVIKEQDAHGVSLAEVRRADGPVRPRLVRLRHRDGGWCAVDVIVTNLLDDPADDLSAFIERVDHIQARVGYDQGPQVPHPGAPEYAARTCQR